MDHTRPRYLLHFFVIRGAAGLATLAVHANNKSLQLSLSTHDHASGFRVGLPGVYLTWALVELAAYPVCRWFAGVKRRHKTGLLGHL